MCLSQEAPSRASVVMRWVQVSHRRRLEALESRSSWEKVGGLPIQDHRVAFLGNSQ